MEPVRVTKIIPGGQALGELSDGKKVMLWNALPGELISAWEVAKSKSHYVEGIATTIREPSARRIQPQDDCYLATSPWQIFQYDYELEQKREMLLEILRQQKLTLDASEVNPVQTDGKGGGR